MRLASGADASSLAAQAGLCGSIVLGKAGYMEKDEGVRKVHNWRIQGCVPASTSELAGVGQQQGSGFEQLMGRQAAAGWWDGSCPVCLPS